MNVGAEPKKLALLGGILATAGFVYYINLDSAPNPPSAAAKNTGSAVAPASAAKATASRPNIRRDRPGGRGGSQEFQPTLRPKEPIDPTKVDPTLRLDLLARVQSVEREGGTRSLFAFGTAPAPPAPKVEVGKIKPKTPEEVAKLLAEKAAKPSEPVKPPPPPITLKFYGYSTPRRDGVKRAFFLDGEDIFVAAEGELIKKRYKVVRIGVNSVVMEDTEHKHQQTIILQQEQAG